MTDQSPTPPTPAQVTEQKIATEVEQITGEVAEAINIVSKVNTWTAVCGFFTALPGLTNLMLQMIDLFKTLPPQYYSQLAASVTQIKSATTIQEREDGAKKFAASINDLTSK
jgi:hypothetical protein